jgi:hypothetical protein
MNTFIELFFHALLFIAVLSTGLLMAELRGMTRRRVDLEDSITLRH